MTGHRKSTSGVDVRERIVSAYGRRSISFSSFIRFVAFGSVFCLLDVLVKMSDVVCVTLSKSFISRLVLIKFS